MVHNFLTYKKNIFSQNGEDGIIEQILKIVGTESKLCCEFGAWDGIHLSNVRNLILNGWSGVMIEGDASRFDDLVKTYQNTENVFCINAYVDTNRKLLSKLLKGLPLPDLNSMDFLSIDIDGLDYEIFEMLDFDPRIICIEVNAGHDPIRYQKIPAETAKNNVGQSLGLFTELAEKKGYGLICYTGNAFFGRKDVLRQHEITAVSPETAYKNFLQMLTSQEREWLYLVNTRWVEPHYRFNNRFLDSKNLGISKPKKIILKARALLPYLKSVVVRYVR